MAKPTAIRPVDLERYFARLLVYGEPSVGKSVLAGTSPRALILASDPDEISAMAAMGSKAEFWHVPDYRTLDEAYDYMLHEGCQAYEWVWIDNGTLVQDQGMDEIMADMIARTPTESVGVGAGKKNPLVPDMPQYLLNQNTMHDYVKKFKSLPIHFGLTGLVMTATDREGEEVFLPMFPGTKGQFSQKICAHFGIIAYMTAREINGEVHTAIITNRRDQYLAKDRYNALGGSMVDATIPKMMSLIKKKLPSIGTKPPTKVAKAVGKKAAGVKKAAVKKAAAPRKAVAKKAAPASKKAVAKRAAASTKKGQ